MRTVAVRLMAEVSGYVAGLRVAAKSTQDFAGKLDTAARAGKLDAVADSAARMGIVAAAGFATVIAATARFDKQMSAVSAATHAGAQDMERLRDAALEAGAATQYSATEAARGIEELAKAGVSTSDILGGGLKGALSLAAAGSMEVGEAAEVAASALTQFRLRGSDVPHVADLLAAAAGKAQGSVHDMSMALNMSGLVAAQMGLSIEETVGSLALFAHAGLLGSDAGTSFKQAMLMLANPTDKAAGLMEELGISAYDAQGKFVGVAALAGQLKAQLGGLTQQQRNSALATMFGADAIRVASILYAEGSEGVNKYTGLVNDQGYAAETAAKKTDNLVGDIERLTGSLETLAIKSGSGANSGLRLLVQGAEKLVDQFGSLPPVVGSTVTLLAGIGGAALLAGAGWVKMRRATADALEELRNTGPAGTRAAAGLQRTTMWAGRAGAAFVALQVAAAAVTAGFGSNLNPQVDALAKGLADWARDGAAAGETARIFGDKTVHLHDALKSLNTGTWSDIERGTAGAIEGMTGLGSVMDNSLQKSRERLAALDQALTQMVQSGQGAAAAAVFNKLAAEGSNFGISVDELKKGLPGYAGAIEAAGGASKGAAGDIKSTGDAATDAAGGVDKLREAAEQLAEGMLSVRGAKRDFEEAIDAARDAAKGVKKGDKKALDVGTEKGRGNEAKLDAIAASALNAATRIRELGGTQAEVDGIMAKARQEYIKVATAMGMDAEKAAELADKLLGIPKDTKAKVSAPGAEDAKKKAQDFKDKLNEIPSRRNTQVAAPGAETAKEKVRDYNFVIRSIPPYRNTRISCTGVGPSIEELGALKRYINSVPKYVNVRARVTTEGDVHIPGQGKITRRWGGITEHARSGMLREAAYYSPVQPARYGFAEPATGGEAFVPKFGDYERSMAILDKAAGWYGAQVTPHGYARTAVMHAAPRATTVTHVHQYNLHAGVVGSGMELETWFARMNDRVKARGRG